MYKVNPDYMCFGRNKMFGVQNTEVKSPTKKLDVEPLTPVEVFDSTPIKSQRMNRRPSRTPMRTPMKSELSESDCKSSV